MRSLGWKSGLIGLTLGWPLGPLSAGSLATTPLTQMTRDPDTAYLVRVRVGTINNLSFLIDTAATRSVIAPWVRLALGLKSVEGRNEQVTAAGGDVGATGYIVPSIAIQDAVQHDVRVVVLDLEQHRTWITQPVDGILGTDYLRNYDVRIDGAAKTMELHARTASLKPSDADVSSFARVPFETVGAGFMVMPVSVNGFTLSGILDTGASRSVLNRRAAELVGLREEDGQPLETTAADGKAIRIIRQSVKRLDIGGVAFLNETVSVGDLPVFRQFRLDDVPAIILGASVMRDRVAMICHSSNRLYLAREVHPLESKVTMLPAPAAPPAS